MTDIELNGIGGWISTADGLQIVRSAYHCMEGDLSTRSRGLLSSMEGYPEVTPRYLMDVMSLTRASLLEVRGCGIGTAQELASFSEEFRSIVLEAWIEEGRPVGDGTAVTEEKEEDFSPFRSERTDPGEDLPPFVDSLLPVLEEDPYFGRISVRARNRVFGLIEECGNSLRRFYGKVNRKGFTVDSLRGVGKTVRDEVGEAISHVKEFIGQKVSSMDEDSAMRATALSILLKKLDHTAGATGRIEEKWKELGYFPFFSALEEHFLSYDSNRSTILQRGMAVRKGISPVSRDEIASELGLTRERVRQLSVNIVEDIVSSFRSMGETVQASGCPYENFAGHYEAMTNLAEEVSFTENLLSVGIAYAYPGFTLIGNPERGLIPYHKEIEVLVAVPSSLSEEFDFGKFIRDLSLTRDKEWRDEGRIPLTSLMETCFKVKIGEGDDSDFVFDICRDIVRRSGYSMDADRVVFPKNAYKPITEIIYEILLERGHAMTASALESAIREKYPDRKLTPGSLGANARLHEGIIAVGRTSTYSLREWSDGEDRGGTIRSFVSEYLDSVEGGLAPVDDVVEYVRRFRPSTNVDNVTTNLLLHSDHKFSVFVKDGVRCIGYSDREEDPSVVKVIPRGIKKRPFPESLALLEEFISKEGRFPRQRSGEEDSEESRLARFVGIRDYNFKIGKMDGEEKRMWEEFMEKYGNLIHRRRSPQR